MRATISLASPPVLGTAHCATTKVTSTHRPNLNKIQYKLPSIISGSCKSYNLFCSRGHSALILTPSPWAPVKHVTRLHKLQYHPTSPTQLSPESSYADILISSGSCKTYTLFFYKGHTALILQIQNMQYLLYHTQKHLGGNIQYWLCMDLNFVEKWVFLSKIFNLIRWELVN